MFRTEAVDVAVHLTEPEEKPSADTIVRAVREQLGLELTTATRPVEVVVVEKEERKRVNQ